MEAILFKSVDVLSDFDDTRYVPFDRAGCVLDTWVAYFHRLKSSVKRYEGQDSLQAFLCKPLTSRFLSLASEGTVARKRKPLRHKSKGKKGSEPLEKKSKSSPPQPSSAFPPSKKNSNNRSPKTKKEHVVGTRASKRLKAKPSNKVFSFSNTTSCPIVISDFDSSRLVSLQVEEDSPPQSEKTQATTQGSSVEKDAPETTAESPNSDHDSTPGGNADVDEEEHATLDVDRADSTAVVVDVGAILTKPDDFPAATSSLEVAPVFSPVTVVPSEAASPSTIVVPPHKESALVGVIPTLASLLPEDDAIILSEFSARHVGFLLPEDVFPRVYLKPAYSVFAEFLRFVRSHSIIELLSTHKDKVMEDLKAFSLFGFKGEWFDELSRRLDHQISAIALEDLSEVTKAALNVELHNTELKSEIDHLKLELAQGETELARLNAKHKEIEEARAGLNVMFDI
ncbi:hypothetical protein SESBI_41411 [Sesbania bispinosa]|nr:hypothetical protein SESBI_41411 [Sesbania bispinosa]